jgi:parvulin-like peptidyl-prolyl isomerase
MTPSIVKFSCAGLLAVLFAASACAQTNTPPPNASPTRTADKLAQLFGDDVITKGKGVEIKRSQLDAAVLTAKGSAAAAGQVIPPGDTQRLEKRLLQQLIRIQLLLARATETERAKAKENFEKAFQKYKDEAKLTDAEFDAKLNPQLKAQGLSREQWDKQRIEQATLELVLEREIKTTVTDEEVKKYYDENPARFEQPELARVSHILLATANPNTRQPLPEPQKVAKRRLADDALKRAKAGEDFAKLVKEFSEDPSSKDRGGEYTFPRGQTPAEFEATAFALNEGQISDVITTPAGYHILKVLERTPAKKLEFAKVSENIKKGLAQMAIEKQLPDYFDKLIKEAAVEILDEKLRLTEQEAAEISGKAKLEPKK